MASDSAHFLINAANLQKGGGLQVAVSLLEEWSALPDYQFTVIASPQLAEACRLKVAGNIRLIPLSSNPTASFGAWRYFARLAGKLEAQTRPRAVLTIFGPGLWRPKAPHLMGFANGLYLFNRSRFVQDDWPTGQRARWQYALRRRILLYRVKTEADAWWVETDEARAALAQALQTNPNNITIVSNALSDSFVQHLGQPTATPAIEEFRLLVMGSAYPNKNIEIIPKILPLLNDKAVHFYLTLPEEEFGQLHRLSGYASQLHNLGPLRPGDAPAAYASCHALFSPTKLETLSAVYLEAMAMRRPILASDLPFARNVCGDAAVYFNPWSAEDAAIAILKLKYDSKLQNSLAERGARHIKTFPTAADRAQCLLSLLEKLATRQR